MILKWIIGVLNALSLVIIVLYTAVCVPTFNMGFYEAQFSKNGTYEVVDMKKEHLLAVTEHMLKYMSGSEPNLNTETVVSGEKRLFFSEREILHMEDVAALFDGGRLLFYVALSVFSVTGGLCLLFKIPVKTVSLCYIAVPICVIAMFGVVGIMFAADFNRAFTVFHEIFFTNDLWLLDPSVDLLVNIVPTAFFMDLGLLILVLFLAGLSIMAGAGVFFRKRAV